MVRPALLGCLVLLGCGGDNALGGSLGEVISLEVSRSDVYRNDEALQVTYYRNRGVFYDVVVRVSVALKDVELKPGVRIPLEGEYEPGHQRTSVATAPGGEPVRVLPNVKKGDMVITSGGVAGGVTRGNFSMLFEGEGGDLGFNRTLSGNFAAMTVDAGFEPNVEPEPTEP
ncbi:MAG: hypothetical protein JNG84_03240 [Archangium sp.]|nr:hypothetical protein [Archangium sp.]